MEPSESHPWSNGCKTARKTPPHESTLGLAAKHINYCLLGAIVVNQIFIDGNEESE